jgi:hypothetical protein
MMCSDGLPSSYDTWRTQEPPDYFIPAWIEEKAQDVAAEVHKVFTDNGFDGDVLWDQVVEYVESTLLERERVR